MRLRTLLSKGRVLTGLLAAALGMSLLGPAAAGPLRSLARLVIAPAGEVGMYATTAVRHHVDEAMRETISQDEARALRKENAYLRSVTSVLAEQLTAAMREIDAIQDIRSRLYGGPTDEMPSELIRARVVAGDSLPYSATRIVGSGSGAAAQGRFITTRELWTGRSKALPSKLAAITASAFVGRITESDAFTARLQLVTDAAFRINVQIRRVVKDPKRPRRITVTGDGGPERMEPLTLFHPRIAAEAHGDGAAGIVIPRVGMRDNIRPGDEVATLADAVGASILIGHVQRVQDDPDDPLLVTLYVAPHANLDALREVYIIVPPARGGGAGGQR